MAKKKPQWEDDEPKADEAVAETIPVVDETIPATGPVAEPADDAKAEKLTEWNTPEALALYDAETQQRVTDQSHVVGEAESEYENKKLAASDAKKLLEAEEKRLRTLINERSARRGKAPEPTLFPEGAGGLFPEMSDCWPPANLWEEFPLERLTEFGLSESIIGKLAAGEMKKGKEGIGPVTTMGSMSRYTAPSASGWVRQLTDIKGIGDEAADKYRDAETKFWTAWNGGLGIKFAEERGLTKPEPVKDAADESEAAAGNDQPEPATADVAA